MAKVRFGAIVTDMRNKLGSQVFSRNRYGAYTRSFQTSVASSTPDQVAVRNRLGSLATAWASLTQTQRDAWNGAVDAFRSTDVFGSVISPSGFDLYVKLNCNLEQVGESAISLPPLPGSTPSISDLAVTAESVTPFVQITMDESMIDATYRMVVSATACISSGKNYVKNLLRVIDVLTPDGSGVYNVSAAYVAKHITVTTGKRISVSVVVVNTTTGQKSIPIHATCIVSGVAGLDYNEALDTGIPLT